MTQPQPGHGMVASFLATGPGLRQGNLSTVPGRRPSGCLAVSYREEVPVLQPVAVTLGERVRKCRLSGSLIVQAAMNPTRKLRQAARKT